MVLIVLLVFVLTFIGTIIYQLVKQLIPVKRDAIVFPYEEIDENKQAELEDSISFYEIRIEQLKELSRMYENELETTTDAKKRRTLLSKCLSLDQQTYNAQQKLNKLKRDV
jgi:hypothetical protein